MTLDTVKIDITPEGMLRIMAALDKRFGFILQNGSPDVHYLTQALDIWVDGSETCEQIVLHPDGTWTASTHVVLGQKMEEA